jgi:predicted RNase H-like HicB family nuclease
MSAMVRYGIVIEKGEANYSAYVPDLPGCVTTGATVAEIMRNMREAIELHLAGMSEDGENIPAPSAIADYVDIDADATAV